MNQPQPSVAILLPCFNEEATIDQVVKEFRQILPQAEIYVFDNASSDQTGARASAAGAKVIYSKRRGKGNVVQHMFDEVLADYYVMADGDSTYSARDATRLLEAIKENSADMVVGCRVTSTELLASAYRPMHQFGNRLICWLISHGFGERVRDAFSGYRAFTRRFVKTVPLHSEGFEIEVEMALQAIALGYAVVEIDVPYGVRPEGSVSKLNTYKDGFLVFKAFIEICRHYRPGAFFGITALFLLIAGLAAGVAPIVDYVQYHYVYHVPLAILATGLGILAALSFAIAIILAAQIRYHRESLRLIRRNFV